MAFHELLPAEKRLLTKVLKGAPLVLSEKVPTAAETDNHIRSQFLRLLIIHGGSTFLSGEKVVAVAGAWISGDIDIEDRECITTLSLTYCHIDGALLANDTALSHLALSGSVIRKIAADRLRCQSSVFLDSGLKCQNECELKGARILSNLNLEDSIFGSEFVLGDEVSNAEQDKVARDSINLENATIEGAIQMNGAVFVSTLCRSHCKCKPLVDTNVKEVSSLKLDGFVFDRYAGSVANADKRRHWLLKQVSAHLGEDFRPQPWDQSAKAFMVMGHAGYAKNILLEKEKWKLFNRPPRNLTRRAIRWVEYLGVGFGHRPMRLVYWNLVVWLLGVVVYSAADTFGLMGPASDQILSAMLVNGHQSSSDEVNGGIKNQSKLPTGILVCSLPAKGRYSTWTAWSGLPKEYSTFSVFAFSADVQLPIIDLHQETEWAPIVAADQLLPNGRLERRMVDVNRRVFTNQF